MTNPWYWFRRTALKITNPLLRWAGPQHLPFTHKLVTGRHYYDLLEHVKPGTIFVTRIQGELTDALIPGYWTHVGMYAPEPGKKIDELVVEAVGVGVRKEDLVTFACSKDYLLALEPVFLDESIKDKVMARASEIASTEIGKPYDYQFDYSPSDMKAFYCSELAWYSYDTACKEAGVDSPFQPRITLGVPTVTPDDLPNATTKFKVVWDSRIALAK